MPAWILKGLWIACQSFDLSTTVVALRQPGSKELNPILRPAVVEIKVSVNVGLFVFNEKKYPNNKIVPSIMAGYGCAAGTWNMKELNKLNGVRK